MTYHIERPLDFLSSLKNKDILITTKTKNIKAKLLTFDIHHNLVLEILSKPVFLRGEQIISVEPQ